MKALRGFLMGLTGFIRKPDGNPSLTASTEALKGDKNESNR
jgi:hypothetical protein